MCGLPDYEAFFEKELNFNAGNADGITSAQEIRLCIGTDGQVEMHYRPDCTEEGWYPRPVLPTAALSNTWASYFKPTDSTQGNPVSVINAILFYYSQR